MIAIRNRSHATHGCALALIGVVLFSPNTALAEADQTLVHREMVETLEAYAVYKMGRYDEAFEKWLALAEKGNAQGILNVGNMYAAGEGVAQDEALALSWYQKGAAQGDPHCLFQLAEAFSRGQGTTEDRERALSTYRAAAAAGSAQAQLWLGRWLLGRGSQDEAANWLRRAADGGEQEALALLEQVDAGKAGAADDARRIHARSVETVRSLLAQLDAAANARDAGWLTREFADDAKIRVQMPGEPGLRELSRSEYETLWEKTFIASERYRFTRTGFKLENLPENRIRAESMIREYFTDRAGTKVLALAETLVIRVDDEMRVSIEGVDLVVRPAVTELWDGQSGSASGAL